MNDVDRHYTELKSSFFSKTWSLLAVLASDGTLAASNDAFQRVVPNAAAGTSFYAILCGGDRLRVEALLGGLAPDASIAFDAMVGADSAPELLRFSATRDESGDIYVVGVTTPPRAPDDARLRDELSSVERQSATLGMFSRVLETAPIVLWAIDRAGNYTMSEGKGLEALGFKPGECVGLNALEMYKGTPDIATAIVRALGGEESRLVSAPAPGLHFESWYMPLCHKPGGEVYGAMGLGIDVTERVTSEREVREKLDLIEQQSATIRALATPIIQVWDEVLCLPVIGTVDSARTADMMQSLLESIVREQARYAIVDLTGVEVVDTSTADHLIQLFRAAKVLGVDGILCGIRPAVAQTVVALGLELGSVRTMRSLRDALKWCIAARRGAADRMTPLALPSSKAAKNGVAAG